MNAHHQDHRRADRVAYCGADSVRSLIIRHDQATEHDVCERCVRIGRRAREDGGSTPQDVSRYPSRWR